MARRIFEFHSSWFLGFFRLTRTCIFTFSKAYDNPAFKTMPRAFDAYDGTYPFTSPAAQALRSAYRTLLRGSAASWLFNLRRQAHFLQARYRFVF